MLDISQGPLPQNNTVVDPSAFLEAWVAGTTIRNLSAGAFKGGDINFVVAATDPPPLQDRQRGTLWFKRGEGVLYIWDQNDGPSSASSADATVVNWIAIGGRRDIWVRAIEALPLGTPVQLAQSGASNTEHSITAGVSTTLPGGMQYRTQWSVSARNGPWNTASPQANGRRSEVNFVLLETAASGAMTRACELGFCSVLMASGETGIAGPLVLREQFGHTEWFFRQEPEITSGATNGRLFVALATDSSATAPGAPWLRPAFFRPLPPIGTARL